MKKAEVDTKVKEIHTSEVNSSESAMDTLLRKVGPVDANSPDQKDKLSSRLEQQKSSTESISFTGIPREAQRYIDEQGEHLARARKYEREANDLETRIRRGKEPESRMSEVRSLRRKAENEMDEANRCKRRASQILNSPYYSW